MNKTLRKAVAVATSKLNEAELAVQNLQKFFSFKGFGEVKPRVSSSNSGDIIIEYCGYEMDINEAIERMEEYGYIAKTDFNVLGEE